jgi:alpha-L-arabinofuranosidase
MKAVDPSIKIGAVALLSVRGDYPEWWTLPILQASAEDIDFLIVHPYISAIPYMESGRFTDRTAEGVFAEIWSTHPIAGMRQWADAFAPGRPRKLEIQASEWGVVALEGMPRTYDTLHNAVLNTDLLWDMVGEGADGANIWNLSEWPFPTLEPVSGGAKYAQYNMMWMNSRRSGRWLLGTAVASPTYSAGPLGGDVYEQKMLGGADGVPFLSAYATLSEDGRRLYLIVTNKSAEVQTTAITLNGFAPLRRASVWQMTSAAWDDTGVQPAAFEISDAGPVFSYAFPARSVTSIVFGQ